MAIESEHTLQQMLYMTMLDDQMAQLRRVEHWLDDQFRQVVHDLDEEALVRASERFDELVLTFPELRLPGLCDYPEPVNSLLAHIDLDAGPAEGFEVAMRRLCELCMTPSVLRALRSKLYGVAAGLSDAHADLLPTVAIAVLSLDAPVSQPSAFVEMVICASAIEGSIVWQLDANEQTLPDVSTWLAANPSDALVLAVGEDSAYYYASIPGVLPLLNPSRVLFDVERLVPCAGGCACEFGLPALVDGEYTALLSGEIKRVQSTLRRCYPDRVLGDVEMLTSRALDALEVLPAHVNPLLQAILVQSWVRYLSQASKCPGAGHGGAGVP